MFPGKLLQFSVVALGACIAALTAYADGTSASAAAIATPLVHVTFAGVMANSAATAMTLRLANRGPTTGTATVTLLSTAGATLGTWTSPQLPLYGAMQVALSAIAAGATPALTASEQAQPLNIAVSTTFGPWVQLLATNPGGGISNITACGTHLVEDIDFLGYVEGPGTSGVTSAVRIVNSNPAQTLAAQLSLYNAATGASLGIWDSPSVPPNGSLTIPTATLASSSAPNVPASTAALTIVAKLTPGLRLEHVVMAGGTLADMTDACLP